MSAREGDELADRPGGAGRRSRHATQMSQPRTLTSGAPVAATMLAAAAPAEVTASASVLIESLTWSSSNSRSRSVHGVGRGSSGYVTIAAPASA
jgi:hypothetical protein